MNIRKLTSSAGNLLENFFPAVSKHRTFIGIVILITMGIFAISLGNEFISDDISGIQYNSNLSNIWYHVKTFNIGFIAYSLLYSSVGANPFFFHLWNIIIHITTIPVLFELISELIARVNPNQIKKQNIIYIPILTTLLFALHPIGTESVTWISGNSYALYTFFLLVSMLFFIRGVDINSNKLIFYSLCGYIFALSSSEKAIAYPLVIGAYLVIFRKLTKKSFIYLLPFGVVTLLFGLSLIFKVSARVEYFGALGNEITPINPLLQIPIAYATYVKLFLYLTPFTFYHEFVNVSLTSYGMNLIITILLLLTILICYKKSTLIAFGLSLFMLSIIPTLLPVNFAWVVAERYIHYGSIGFFLALSTLFLYFADKFNIKTKQMLEFIAILTLVLLFTTGKRNLEWKNQDTLWPVTVKTAPTSAYAHNNMGDYYTRHNDPANAIQSFETARLLRPRYADATHNLANVYMGMGNTQKAAALYQEALEYNPQLFQSYRPLGFLRLGESRFEEAIELLNISIAHNADPFIDYIFLGEAYRQLGKLEEANQSFLTAQKLANGDQQRLLMLQKAIKNGGSSVVAE